MKPVSQMFVKGICTKIFAGGLDVANKVIRSTAVVMLCVLTARQATAQFAGGGGGGTAPAKPIDATFLEKYALGVDETLVWVRPPFIESRKDAYVSLDPAARMGGMSSTGWPIVPGGMIIQWSGDKPTLKAKTPRLDQAFTVLSLLRQLYGPTLAQPKIDRRLMDMEIPGDFALKAAAKEEELGQPLGKILSSALGKAIKVDIRTEVTDTYVLTGEFKYTAIADELWQETAPAGIARPSEGIPHFYVYSTDLGPQVHLLDGAPKSWNRRLNTSSKNTQTLVDVLAERINAPVVIDAKGMPARYAYDDHGNVIKEGEAGEAENTKLILDHLAQQMGLTWKKEQREVRRVVVVDGVK
jgi:hypothetical protein